MKETDCQNGVSHMSGCCPIVELRQYTLHDGRRDALIELFDREFAESQEVAGIRVIGQFRDLDDCNRFVWLRGFESMAARREALAAFYGGPAWEAHRSAANATMLDSDNVLLLHPSGPCGGFDLSGLERDAQVNDGLVTATIHYLDADTASSFESFFESEMKPTIMAAGGSLLATLVTETSSNTFPALPVRAAEHVFVWFMRFPGPDCRAKYGERLQQSGDWREAAPPELLCQFMRKPEILNLKPTRRSLLR